MPQHKSFPSVLRKIASNSAEIKRYAAAVRSISTPVFAKISAEDKSTFYKTKLLDPGTYEFSILYTLAAEGAGEIVGIEDNGPEILKLPISSLNRYTKQYFKLARRSCVTFRFRSQTPTHATIFGIGMRIINAGASLAQIAERSVCAAIASYPPRIELLRDCIESLLPQVDHLFVYLNNYRDVPKYLHDYDAGKLHYILDTNSAYRASAKFFWLDKHECYWLICDDDIIYPPNYAQTMLERFRQHGERCIVGAHATIFASEVQDYWRSRLSNISFSEALDRDQRVHMLGSGTLFLHSRQLPAVEVKRLLSYATENDEMLAIICKRLGLLQVSIEREAQWIKSHPEMKWGLFEENMTSPETLVRLSRMLSAENPWPPLPEVVPNGLQD